MNDHSDRIDPGFAHLLEHMIKLDASDLYLTDGCPPTYRVNGEGLAGKTPATAATLQKMAASIMTPEQLGEFAAKLELNLALSLGDGRFRINVFQQKGSLGMVVRHVRTKVASLDDLGLPSTLMDVMSSKRGLVLVVGGTGSGKSTTLAAMIDHRNSTHTGHIVTVEDPVEFIHSHKRCVVTQREVGVDTRSYASALKNTLRQAPDVILIGEIRDAETMEAALAFAETGHLCLSTLHANSADQAIERVLSFFPSARHHEILLQLSFNLRAIVSQRLVPAIPAGRAAALEILLDTPRIKDLLKRGEVHVLKDAMEQSLPGGCRTFDEALFELCSAGRISEEEAVKFADSANNLRLRIERQKRGEERRVTLRLAGEMPSTMPMRAVPAMSGLRPAVPMPIATQVSASTAVRRTGSGNT